MEPAVIVGYCRDTAKEETRHLLVESAQSPRKTFVCEANGEIPGTYCIKASNEGPDYHVCNCVRMVSSAATGKGLVTSMCEYAQQVALELNYKAMQFNVVAFSNEGAVRLWNKLGFETVGTLPRTFYHPDLGYIDAYVMYQ